MRNGKENSLKIETENEELKKQLQQTQKELEAYKNKLQKLKGLSKGPLNALAGSFKTTSLYETKTPAQANVSELARKASAIFSADPSAKELKLVLRQLLVAGDPTAKRLASNASTLNATELIAYLKARQLGLGNDTPQKKKEIIDEKALARAQELAELRAEGGISVSHVPKALENGFENASISIEASASAQKRAIERFASKRERPQSYGYYYQPPAINKSKVLPKKLQNNLQSPSIPQQKPINHSAGLLNLTELASSSGPPLGINNFQPKSGGYNMPPAPHPQGFGMLNPLNPLMQQPFGGYPLPHPAQNFNGFEMPGFHNLNSGYIPPPLNYNIPRHSNINDLLRANPVLNNNNLKPQPVQRLPLKHRNSDGGQSSENSSQKKPPRRWTDEEDELLRKSVQKYGARNWKKIATEVPNRNHVQCLQRWRKALDPKVVKGHWSPEEDVRLLELVTLNPKNWGHVARGIEGRTAKQCRERYHNHLDPNIKKGNWTFEEDKIIVLFQKELGNKWADIAKQLPGRTENSVKIRWKSIKRQVIALKDEKSCTQPLTSRKIKRNTMDRSRLEKLLEVWDFSSES